MALSKTEPQGCLYPASLSFVLLKEYLVPELDHAHALQSPEWIHTVHMQNQLRQMCLIFRQASPPKELPIWMKCLQCLRNILVSAIYYNPVTVKNDN